jgi:hypothetical protein
MALQTCFISASSGTDLTVIRRLLEDRGIRPIAPESLAVASDWTDQLLRKLRHVDLVIGVIAKGQPAQVFFELGLAAAAGRRILLIVPRSGPALDMSLRNFLVVRAGPRNRAAIGFALDQITAAPGKRATTVTEQLPSHGGLGNATDAILESIGASITERNWSRLERDVAEGLRAAGADVVSSSRPKDVGSDLAVWSDYLEPVVGNPMLIELKARILSRVDARQASAQVSSYANASGARWALLLYAEGLPSDDPIWFELGAPLLASRLDDFFNRLRKRSYPEVIRDLRNERVHGARR